MLKNPQVPSTSLSDPLLYEYIAVLHTGTTNTESGTRTPTASEGGATKSTPFSRHNMPSTQTREGPTNMQIQLPADSQGMCIIITMLRIMELSRNPVFLFLKMIQRKMLKVLNHMFLSIHEPTPSIFQVRAVTYYRWHNMYYQTMNVINQPRVGLGVSRGSSLGITLHMPFFGHSLLLTS